MTAELDEAAEWRKRATRLALELVDARAEASKATLRAAKLSDQINEMAQTAENFRQRFKRAEKAIARARATLRNLKLTSTHAYRTLDWRRR